MEFGSGPLESLEMKSNFWNKKKVFLTGHTGFKGSWLSLMLQKNGADLAGFSLPPPTHPSLFEIAKVRQGMKNVEGDVRDFKILQSSLKKYKPEVVFHLAAQSLVKPSYLNPVETYSANVMGTVHLLEACRHTPSVKVIVIVTSDKCYENKEWARGYRETDSMGGYDPYSSSKGCAELVVSAYRNSFFNPKFFKKHGVALASVRAGNVIGGGDFAEDRLIPDLFRSIQKKKPTLIRNPKATRPWQHVLEPLHGYLHLAEKMWKEGSAYNQGWNFGPHESDVKTVGWVADQFVSLWDGSKGWIQDKSFHPHEAHSLRLDCSMAKNKLGWVPKLNLEKALVWVKNWYQSYEKKEDMRSLTLNQIEQYTRL